MSIGWNSARAGAQARGTGRSAVRGVIDQAKRPAPELGPHRPDLR
ncbi:hypothetical protein [Saccharopolyspora oryzae]|uniref:Uncharacterized protein n=1 Tax=Saccharopolyspora oryzae TaxID=2997343 RepID=A0ABT4V8L5_9PSEU|nr:hypothetical protein [Saccharopolyspora oryzae]MDA3630304.1 hypothetical protein [Saccharopolyspora oryzae]